MLHTLRNRMSLVKSFHLMKTSLIRIGIGLWFLLGSLGLALICTYYYFNVLMATNVSICEISIFVSYTSLMCVSCFCLGLLICFSGFEKGFSCNRLVCYGISTISSLSSIQIGYFLLVLMLRNDISMIIAYSYIYILFNFPISIFSNIKFALFQNAAEYFCVIWFMGQALNIKRYVERKNKRNADRVKYVIKHNRKGQIYFANPTFFTILRPHSKTDLIL